MPSRVTSAAPAPTAGTVVESGGVHLSEYETDEEKEEEQKKSNICPPSAARPNVHAPPRVPPPSASAPPPRPLNQRALQPVAVTLGEPSASASESGSEYDTESESGSESESDAPAPLLKPVFVSKRDRGKVASEHVDTTKRDAMQTQAQKQLAHDLAAARVVRDLQEQKHEEEQSYVDDTDGLDPDAEFAAWRARELARMERVRQAERMRKAEEAEVARRRMMPESQRLAEDVAYAKQTRAAKQRGHQGFMQKYYHKGAFFQDMDILQRDYTHSTVDAVDKSQLPQVMQKRNFGKRSQSKWTHLAGEDTTRQGEDLRLHSSRMR